MTAPFFDRVPERIPFGGLESSEPLSFKVYQPDREVLGKRMEDHLRVAVCMWHSFNWPGSDVFGAGTFDRPWLTNPISMAGARQSSAAAFEFIEKLGVPFFTFHDADVAPEGRTFAESRANLHAIADDISAHMERTGAKLLWGTANLFSHPRYAAGAATNPDPEVFAYAAAQVKNMLEITHRLGGANYVLWGGREGYETLLNTDLAREERQLARFLALVAEHKHKIGFEGTLLIEPKPQEPTKHQYDYDTATVAGFLERHGLAGEYRVNIEANHATLAGPQLPARAGYGVRDRHLRQRRHQPRRLPERLGHRPVSELGRRALAGAATRSCAAAASRTGGFNFDTKLRRQSIARDDLFHAHIGGMDTLARALLVAADMVEQRTLDEMREERYAGWDGRLGQPGARRRTEPGRAGGARGVGRDRSAARLGPAGDAREPGQPAHLGRGPLSQRIRCPRPRHRRLDDRDQGGVRRRERRGPRRRALRIRLRRCRGRCGASRIRGCGGRAAVAANPEALG